MAQEGYIVVVMPAGIWQESAGVQIRAGQAAVAACW